VPATAFENAIKQISARRWLGLTATPYRRDRLDDLIGILVGPTRHTFSTPQPHGAARTPGGDLQLSIPGDPGDPPRPELRVHPTCFRYVGETDPSQPGWINAVYRELVADSDRNQQILDDVADALGRGRHCLLLTQWTAHLERLADLLRARGHDPVVLRGGMGARARSAAMTRLAAPIASPLLVAATGPFVGEGFDCPALDTLFLAAPVAFKGRLVQYVGRVLRPYPGKATAEVHDYHDVETGVLASSLAKRAPGYTSLGFPDPRRL
jgi:superfamily II DNA or RNA helicase